MQTFLRFEVGCHGDDHAVGVCVVQEREQEGVGAGADTGNRQCAAILHASQQVLHGWSFGGGGNDAGRNR